MSDDEPPDEDDEPLADLMREVESRDDGSEAAAFDENQRTVESEGTMDHSSGPDPTVDDRFAEMGVEDVDSEELWADLLLDDGPTEGSFPPSDTAHRRDGTYHEVTKRLCHRCEYFGDPPTLHCTHEGTTIHELVDMDHYLVSECPMVEADDETGETQ